MSPEGRDPGRDGPSILVAGAINTDLVGRSSRTPGAGETVTGTDFAIFGGGKGANQAFAVRRSGVRTTMLGAVGDDDFGRSRLADLRAEGIATTQVATRAASSSGVALILVEHSGENRILYVPGPTLTISVADAERAIDAADPDLVLTTLEPPLDAVARLVQMANHRAVPIVLNATPEPTSAIDLVGKVDVLIVNETEAEQLLGLPSGQRDWPEVVRRLMTMGPAIVVVTLGGDGAIVGHQGGMDTLAAPSVEVIDTTAAGDTFCGAFAARLVRGDEPAAAARYGVVAGSLAVTVAGAQPSIPTAREIDIVLDALDGEDDEPGNLG